MEQNSDQSHAAVESAENVNVFKLKKPLQAGDKVFTELDLDIDKLSGNDLQSIEQEYLTRFRSSAQLTPMLDSRFRALIVSRLNSFISDDLGKLSATDFNTVQVIILGKLTA
jgi:hypothetical protein